MTDPDTPITPEQLLDQAHAWIAEHASQPNFYYAVDDLRTENQTLHSLVVTILDNKRHG